MIYLVKAEETNLYKIGYTGGQVKDRVKGMQTGCPHKLSIIRECLGSQEREKMLHETFSENRKQGEWFKFDEETLEKVFEDMDSINKLEEWEAGMKYSTDTTKKKLYNLHDIDISEINHITFQDGRRYDVHAIEFMSFPSQDEPKYFQLWGQWYPDGTMETAISERIGGRIEEIKYFELEYF